MKDEAPSAVSRFLVSLSSRSMSLSPSQSTPVAAASLIVSRPK